MRKKWKDEIRKLKDEIEHLEKNLDIKSDALFEHQKLICFLSEHDKDDVVVLGSGGLFPTGLIYCADRFGEENFCIQYLYHTFLKSVNICLSGENHIEVIDKCDDKIVIKAIDKNNEKSFRCFRITKHNGDITEVTEYYQTPTTDDKADTPTETDFKYFTAEQVRKMSSSEVKANYSDIRKSMELW